MQSNHLPKNTTFHIGNGIKAEIYWQSVNADHIAKNFYQPEAARSAGILFTEFGKMLKMSIIKQVPKSDNKFYAFSYYKGNYYKTILSFARRVDTVFAVIITTNVYNNKKLIEEYRQNYTVES